MTADNDIRYPSGFGLEDVVGWGTTGLVVLDDASKIVIKTAIDGGDDLIQRERKIYERFTERGGHAGILRYHGTFESGIRLEYASNHHLRSFNKKPQVTLDQRLRWAIQIVEALDFVHRAGVIHGDLTCANIFLDEDLNVKLADFAGSSIDGSPLLVAVTASHEYPGSLLSRQADIFALGCVLYEIMTGSIPYEGESEEVIQDRYTNNDFPTTECLGAFGLIIMKCWQGKYTECGAIAKDLKGTCFPNSVSSNH
jgi:serine/threonine protein kinase